MRKTMSELTDILFHAYESGDIDNIFYGRNWDNMSNSIKQELDNIELEDLGTIKENAYGVILWRPHHNIDRDFIFSMLEENEQKHILPELTSLHFMIAENYFTVRKDGKKISASLYATPQKWAKLTEPLAYEIQKAKENDENYYNARTLAWKIGIYNPYYYALKSSTEFINTDIRTLCLVIEQYLNETFGINQEIIERSQAYNNIENWKDLFPRTKRDLEPLFTFARKRISAPRFIPTPNNKATNDLIAALVKPSMGQTNILNNLEVPVSRTLTLTFEDINKIETPKTVNGMKLFVMLLQKFIEHPNKDGDVQMSIDEIKLLRGYSNWETAYRETRKAINELSKIGFEVKDRNKSSGYIRLNAGICFIKNGILYWRFTKEFLPWIVGKGNYIADVPKEVLSTKYTNSFYLGYYISIDHRRNEGKADRKISVKSLINCCPDLKEKYEKRDRLKQYIMEPLIRDLNNISGETFYFDWYGPDGNRIDIIENVKTNDFLNCSIQVDYSDFPQHPARLKHAATRRRQEQAAYDREKAKRKIKNEADDQ